VLPLKKTGCQNRIKKKVGSTTWGTKMVGIRWKQDHGLSSTTKKWGGRKGKTLSVTKGGVKGGGNIKKRLMELRTQVNDKDFTQRAKNRKTMTPGPKGKQ